MLINICKQSYADNLSNDILWEYLYSYRVITVRQTHLVDTDTESELEEPPSEIEECQPLVSKAPLTDEEFEVSEASDTKITSSHSSASSDSIIPLSPDHPLTHTSPTPTLTRVSFHRKTTRMAMRTYRSFYETPSPSSSLTLPIRKRYREDESHSLEDEGHGSEDEGPGSEEEEAAPEGQQQAAPIEDIAMDEPLGLGYGALRCHELTLGEGSVPNTFEVGQSSRSVPKHEGAERISAFRQPTLVTRVDPEDGRVYTDILTYAPPVAPVQTSPSPEWSSGSLPVSPSSLAVLSPIALPVTTPTTTISIDKDQFLEVGVQLELHGSILHDHTHHLDALPPNLFEGYDQDLRELYTRSRIDAHRAAMWHDIYDIQRENHDLRRQIAKEKHERLELIDHVARMERRQESRGGVVDYMRFLIRSLYTIKLRSFS
ncbi:hypothetical protein Tco_1075359 [Tanacetum coccineum]